VGAAARRLRAVGAARGVRAAAGEAGGAVAEEAGGSRAGAGEFLPPPVFRDLKIQGAQGRGGLGYRFTVKTLVVQRLYC
jgi:hypothetical protein